MPEYTYKIDTANLSIEAETDIIAYAAMMMYLTKITNEIFGGDGKFRKFVKANSQSILKAIDSLKEIK